MSRYGVPGQGRFGTHQEMGVRPDPPECQHEWVTLSGGVPPVEKCIHCHTNRIDRSEEWRGVPEEW